MLLAPRIDIFADSKSDHASRLEDRLNLKSSNSLVIIDPDVDNPQELAAGLVLGATVRILDPRRDRISQITEIVREYPNLETLHLVSHGSPGCLHLGNSQLNLDTLPEYAEKISTWFSQSSRLQTPSLLLYGCNVAQGNVGREFISKLQQLTHTQIQASSTKIGNSELGGNWQLDIAIAKGDSFSSSSIAFNFKTQKNYAGIFAAPVANDDPLTYSAEIELSTLDGSNGFVLNGIDAGDNSGYSVSSIGDFNGDGIADLIIGAPFADSNDGESALGESYVVFGTSNPSSSIELSALDGSNGFVLNGISSLDFSGRSVSSAGDFNGDGLADILIGASGADPNGRSSSGESYVVFGTSNPSSSIELSTLDGSNGFVINGVAVDDLSGDSVSSAGDFNGDGLADLVIGADGADPNGIDRAGETYVVFGTSNEITSVELSSLDGNNGFVINGIAVNDLSGDSVSSAGDFNGDGLTDLIIGARSADPNGIDRAGETYVLFGIINPSASIELSRLDGNNGFVINGINLNDSSGSTVSSAGDFNGDGLADLIIGARSADPNGSSSGESYVVFGSNETSASVELSSLDGNNGFVINGIDSGDRSGVSVSNAGDFNQDGFTDLLIGAEFADPNGGASGETYVLFGTGNPSASVELSSLDGNNGFVINGIDSGDLSGSSVSNAGDVNGDGITDLIIGAFKADPNGSASGESYVVFGRDFDTDEDTAFTTSSVLFNDTDTDGDSLTVTEIETTGTLGIVTNNGDGTFDYDPNGQFESLNDGESAIDTFSYTISDGSLTDTATVTIEIGGENDTPIANDDSFNTDENTPLTTSSVLANDTDADEDLLTVTAIDTTGTLGLVTNNGDGTFNYDPNGQFESLNDGESAIDTFSYTISDGSLTDTGNVTIAIAGLAELLPGTNLDDNLLGSINQDLINALDGNDTLKGFAGDDILNGQNGNDSLLGSDGNDTLDGGSGDDTLWGQNDDDSLLGGDGNDTLGGGTGADILEGQNDNDRLTGGDGNDTLNGGLGDDLLSGQNDDDSLRGDDGNDSLYGGNGNDTLHGGPGADIVNGNNDDDSLLGGQGNDTLNGGFGNDILNGRNDDDRLVGGDGNDTLIGGDGADSLWGQNNDDSLVGGDGNDVLGGSFGNDILEGNNDNDRLLGGEGNDTLTGGLGVDTLFGQAGSDRFRLESTSTADRDIIQDFENSVDLFELTGNLSFGSLTITQSGNNTNIIETATSHTIATLIGIMAADIDEADFV